ncbi:type I pantothenate kinase [Streptococcaceae bacterium ESL0687]|nr:type I pantothenate kinase [Streptococcaceae bacterium ESL0687]
MREFINFDRISRKDWQDLYKKSLPQLTEGELENIRSLNDRINMQDVVDVYHPLVHLIRIYRKNLEDMTFSKGLFLQKINKTPPLIIGISGSVAVGKSTTARLMQTLLSRVFKHTKVDLVTTDGFLYPNDYLRENNLMHRKGFPESYDMEAIINFLYAVKSGKKSVDVPLYSHEIYDVIPHEKLTIESPDILIVEGINVFQNQQNDLLYMADFFDFSIYVDACEADIERWYMERFNSLLELSKNNPNNYYYQFSKWPRKQALELAERTWKDVNLVNLKDYIKPTRNRADVILHKSSDHFIDTIYLKKY